MDPQQDPESAWRALESKETSDTLEWVFPKREGRYYMRFEDRWDDKLDTAIPPLRLDGANVIISLSANPDDVLLVHSSILERSPYFKTGLSYRWSTSGKQISTDSQISAEETIVHKYGLVLDADREGYTLVGNSPPDEDPICATDEMLKELIRRHCLEHNIGNHECQQRTARKTVDFHRSTYCQSMPSDESLHPSSPLCVSKAQQHAVRDHKILFSMLYQVEVNLLGLSSEELVTCLANVAAYAEYYGLLPFIAKSLEHVLYHQHMVMDSDIMERPTYWLALGYMLRSEPVFADALRHFAGGDWIDRFAANNPEWQDVILLTYKKQLELARSISRTDQELYRVTLVTEHYEPHKTPVRFTFLSEEKRAKKMKSEEAKARYLARKTLGDWLAENISQPHQTYVGLPRNVVYPKLWRLASSGDISIFGHQAASRLASIFHLEVGQSKRPPQQVIEMEMRRAMREVKEVLERHLFPKHCPPARQEPREIGEIFAKQGRRQYYLTHMSITKEEMPWVNEDRWSPITPDFEIKAASKAWLEQVGLGHLKGDGVVGGDGVVVCASPMSAACKGRGWNLY